MFYQISALLLLVSICHNASSQGNLADLQQMQSEPEIYQALHVTDAIHIDGKADDPAWSSAPWSASFVDIEGESKKKPTYDTKLKMLYDDQALYVFAQLEEPHIWGDITDHDAIIYHNNDFEVFLKPEVHADHYYEIEINVLNTLFDLMMPKPYRYGGTAQIHWDTKEIHSAIAHQGSVNNPSDSDDCWTVEMKIPFTAISGFGQTTPPATNDHWLINFSRVQWQHHLEQGEYTRKKDQNGRPLPEDNWVWSPIGVVNMHYPERWGYVQFVKDFNTAPQVPKYHQIKKSAWNHHYALQLFHLDNGRYPNDLTAIATMIPTDLEYQLSYTPNADFSLYTLELHSTKDTQKVIIDALGNINYYE